uniref:Myosin XVB n=1 Tax=Denticeps clupeoides TaxID=299321 RepID=A0AAY4C5Q9_9TELE
MDSEDARAALDIYKLILRFAGDPKPVGWQEQLLGNYIMEKGQTRVLLRDEILSQLVFLTWGRTGEDAALRAWLLLASCLSLFTPSPALEKPLLKYVSDQGPGEYRSLCQHKLLTALQQPSPACRQHPPTQLEWTANQRRGKMVVDVNTFNEETLTAEVESWTTGEQLATWLLQFRGVPEIARGWSVSLLSGDGWTDLTGCDYVMDLLAGVEADYLLSQNPPHPNYLFKDDGNTASTDQSASIADGEESIGLLPSHLDPFVRTLADTDIYKCSTNFAACVQAQQMTLQAMTLSQQQTQQQQQQQLQQRRRSERQQSPERSVPVSRPKSSTPPNIAPQTLPQPKPQPKPQPEPPAPHSLPEVAIMRDTFSDACVRITREERRKMKDFISSIQDNSMKKRVVMAARDNWENYFMRLFPVKSGSLGDTQVLGVSHRGIKLLRIAQASGINPKHLKQLCSYSFAEVLSVEQKGAGSVVFTLKNETLELRSSHAPQITAMVQLFLRELVQGSEYVVALKSYATDDKSLLSFRKGDVIKLLNMDGIKEGWLFGSVGGRSGLFPSDATQPSAPPDYHFTHINRDNSRKSMRSLRPPPLLIHAPVQRSPVLSGIPPVQRQVPPPAVPNGSPEKEFLRDEIYVQVIKQITQNPQQKGCMLGWRLLALLTGFFSCSNTLRPYVIHYLQDCIQDPQHAFQGPILSKKFRITGFFSMCVQLAVELVTDLCAEMGIVDPAETKEFSIKATRAQIVRPIHPYEYIFDFLLDDGSIVLTVQRVVWNYPLHFDNKLYIEVHFHQVLADYLDGKLILPGKTSSVVQEMAELAALQHLAQGHTHKLSM